MARPFDYFVVLAGMRTGSNLLEERLNAFDGLSCLGEVFNPAFVGHAGQQELFGLDAATIAADPAGAVKALRANTKGLAGFRLFRDHNEAALRMVLQDPRCAKIVLRRNPVESWVSLEIARQTDQWRLGDQKNAKAARVQFRPEEFERYAQANDAFFGQIRSTLQLTGQTAFWLDYADLLDEAVIAGLGLFLGVEPKARSTAARIKKQNPQGLEEKVSNHAEMLAYLANRDPMGLHDPMVFEPPRRANVPSFLAAEVPPLLFLPIKGGPTGPAAEWLQALAGEAPLRTGMTQKDLRQWKRQHPGHRSFVILRHPLPRALEALRRHLIEPGPDHYPAIRAALVSRYGLPLPEPGPIGDIPIADLRRALLAFLEFLHGNLAGQSSVRVDGAWASQAALLAAFAPVCPPDHVLREEEMEVWLPHLARMLGAETVPALRPDQGLHELCGALYDDAIEKAARAAYQRDYMMFGFRPYGALP